MTTFTRATCSYAQRGMLHRFFLVLVVSVAQVVALSTRKLNCSFICNKQQAPLRRRPLLSIARSHTPEASVDERLLEPSVPKIGAMSVASRPNWFHVEAPGGSATKYDHLKVGLRKRKLTTVCEEAQCPNIGECWNSGTSTIMILGDTCTRGCRFCAIKTSNNPPPPDPEEPMRIASEIAEWGIDYVVLTSVDRDDIPDGGAGHFAKTVNFIKMSTNGNVLVECLVGDFQGDTKCVDLLANCGMDVYAHNVETVERLQRAVRDHRANYWQSLRTLERAKMSNPKVYTKSSIMLGLGETYDEVVTAMKDLRSVNCDVVTLGQYLQPSKRHLQIQRYVSPAMFEALKAEADSLGFKYVASGPLIRSSYKAGEYFMKNLVRGRD
eukprot:Selendium_serpulae@DN5587_c0_g1_i1.p2